MFPILNSKGRGAHAFSSPHAQVGWTALIMLLLLTASALGCAAVQASPGTATPGESEPPASAGEPTRVPPRATAAPPTGGDQPVTSDQPILPAPGQSAKARITGRVTDANGKPIAGAALGVVEGTAPVPEMAHLTNADGVYSLTVPAGKFRIAVNKDGYVSKSAEVTVKAGESVTLDWTLDR